MKSKLRNININHLNFKYLITEKYLKEKSWLTVVRVFRENYKNTPLEIKFKSIDEYAVGNMLTSGIVINNESFNLHKPSVIKQLIEEGIVQKWDWKNSKFEISNGLKLLSDLGYNIENLKTN